MFRLRFITIIRKNLKCSTNVVSAAGTGKFDFSPRKSFPAVSQYLTIVRYKSTEGCFCLLSEFDKYVVPLYDKKCVLNPVVSGWWSRLSSIVINDIVHITDPFWNNKVHNGDNLIRALSLTVGFSETNQLLEKFRFGRKIIEASTENKKKLLNLAKKRKKSPVMIWLSRHAGKSKKNLSSNIAIENHGQLNCPNFIHESLFFSLCLANWLLSAASLQEADFLDHRNRIYYIKNKFKIPYEYLLDKLMGHNLKGGQFEPDSLIDDEHIVDNGWMFHPKIVYRKNIYSSVTESIPNLRSEWPSKNEFTISCLRSYESSDLEISIIQEIAKDLNCDLQCIQRHFTNDVLKAKMAKKMQPILRLLKKYGITNKQIRQSIGILNYSPVVIQQRLKLIQDINCEALALPALLLRDYKFDLYCEKLKADKLGDKSSHEDEKYYNSTKGESNISSSVSVNASCVGVLNCCEEPLYEGNTMDIEVSLSGVF